jgi:hypothetical protein
MAFKMRHLSGNSNSALPMNTNTDPTSEANLNASNAPKVYKGGSRDMVNNPDGTKTLTSTRNYTQTGQGEGKNLGPNYKPSAETIAIANKEKASRTIYGSETKKISTMNLKPSGVVPLKPEFKSTMPTIIPRNSITKTPTPNPKQKKPPKRKSYIVQDVGDFVGDVGKGVGKGVKNVVNSVGYAFTKRGAIGSLFGCKNCY